jgi:hypothetical protein
MDFVDRALIAIGDEAARLVLLGSDALMNVLRAAYSIDEASLQGNATADFASFTLGGLDPEEGEDATLMPPPSLRVDALWRGSVRVAASFPKSTVAVQAGRVSLTGLDADVAAANGGVMPSGVALEAARRAELLKRIATLAHHPESATPSVIEAWLAAAGVQSVGDLLLAPDVAAASEFSLTFSAPAGANFQQMSFPIAAALLIRDPTDPGSRLTDMVASARRLQARLRKAGFEPKQASSDAGLGKVVTALVVPESWFDDAQWPGSDQLDRIKTAGTWLAREGIALVPAKLP